MPDDRNRPNPLTPRQAELLESSFEAVAHRSVRLIEDFYAWLFSTAPGVRTLFPDDMSGQNRALLGALRLVVANADDLTTIEDTLHEMGARHVGYGARPEHYPIVRDTMIAAIHDAAEDIWSDEIEGAWTDALDAVAGMMLEGAERAGAGERSAA